MKVELFAFQKRALADIRMKTAEAMGRLPQDTCSAGSFIYSTYRCRQDDHHGFSYREYILWR